MDMRYPPTKQPKNTIMREKNIPPGRASFPVTEARTAKVTPNNTTNRMYDAIFPCGAHISPYLKRCHKLGFSGSGLYFVRMGLQHLRQQVLQARHFFVFFTSSSSTISNVTVSSVRLLFPFANAEAFCEDGPR